MTDRSLADRLHTVAIRLLRQARAADAEAGVSAARLSVLSVLRYGSARTVTELAEAEQVSVPTMTRLLQGLEADGCVVRRRDRADRRVVQVKLTARGRRVLEAGRRGRIRRIERVLSGVPAAETARIAAGVAALESVLGERGPG